MAKEDINKILKEMRKEPKNLKELLDLHKEHYTNVLEYPELKEPKLFKGALREIELIEEWAKKNKIDLSRCGIKGLV